VVENASKDLTSQQQLRDDLRAKLRRDRKQGELLTKESITELKKLDARVKELSKRLKLSRVNLDMEKICVYLQRELEQSSVEQSEQKKIIAEVGLIDKQLSAIMAVVPEQQAFLSTAFSSSSGGGIEDDLDNSVDVDDISISINDSIVGESDSVIDKITTDYLALIDEDELNIISIEVSTHHHHYIHGDHLSSHMML